MKKIIRYFLLALAALLFIGTFVFLYKKSRPKEVKYQDLEVTLSDIRRTTVVTGKIQPRDEVNIKPQINGIIAELFKEAGQMVQKGEVIARLTVIPDMNSLSAAQSRVRLSEINLKQAQTNFDREQLRHRGGVTGQPVPLLRRFRQQQRCTAEPAHPAHQQGIASEPNL